MAGKKLNKPVPEPVTKEAGVILTEVDIGKEAIELVRSEWKAYENALVFVTDKVAFNIRFLIKTLRKNYWGIFDSEKDPVSGQKLTWIPLTEWIVDTFVKNSDRDQKDIRVRAKKMSYVGLSMLIRNLLENWMNVNIFGEEIDETERQLGIDGSQIKKVFKGYDDETGKPKVIMDDVDILNAYFDFTSKSIDAAPRFTERALKFPESAKEMDGWKNTENLQGTTTLHPTDTNLQAGTAPSSPKGAKMLDFWEMWGKMPKYLITGKKADVEQIDGHIVVSGLQARAGEAKWHLIETNPGGKKPYEECHTKRIKGRWLSRGPAESVMMIQGWLNMIVNIRKIRASVSQLGIFKIKKGSGTSPQNMSRLAANGFITVNSMDDIEQFVINEASEGSYKDEQVGIDWAQKVTSSYESVTGEQTPASKSATGIVIENKAAGSTFTMYKKAIGFFFTRLINRHILPIMQEMLTEGEVVRLSGSPEELANYDEAVITCLAYNQIADELDKAKKSGKKVMYDTAQISAEIEKAKAKYKKLGKDRWMELAKVDLTKHDIDVYVGDEKFDAEVMANNLTKILALVPQYQDVVVKEVFDIMGLDSSKIPDRPPVPAVGAPANPAVPAGGGANLQQLVTNANMMK